MSLKTEKIWMDGELVPWEDAKIHVLSHGLHYGTGYFEGIRCYELADGRSAVFRLQEHMRRLADSGKILGFPLPYSVEQMCQATVQVIRANKLKASSCHAGSLTAADTGFDAAARKGRSRRSVGRTADARLAGRARGGCCSFR
jgi:branched-subunit amino acid aminotransferase/4-amino-4-deoxychorismate lyase